MGFVLGRAVTHDEPIYKDNEAVSENDTVREEVTAMRLQIDWASTIERDGGGRC